MRIPRVYCPSAASLAAGLAADAAAATGRIIELDERESHHLIVVLRRRPGDWVRILPGDGSELLGRIIEAHPRAARILIGDGAEMAPAGMAGNGTQERDGSDGNDGRNGREAREPQETREARRAREAAEICVAMALTRGGAFEQALEQLTELGADEIVPLVCERCVVKIAGAAEARQKHERWMRVLEAAAKQCGRRALPRLAEVCRWKDWLESEGKNAAGRRSMAGVGGQSGVCGGGGALWVAHPAAEAESLFAAAADWASGFPASVAASAAPNSRAAVAIGPEGGFAPGEIEAACSRGARLVLLTGNVLRAPTAAAAALLTIRLALEAGD